MKFPHRIALTLLTALAAFLALGATQSAYVLFHQEPTLAALEASLQNREMGFDPVNKGPVGKFTDGTKWHGITQEMPNVGLVGNFTVAGNTLLNGTLAGSSGAYSGTVTSTAAGSGTSSAFLASSAGPTMTWVSTGSGANAKNWDIQASGNTLAFRTRTDANASGTDWLTVTRSGTSITGAALATGLAFNATGSAADWSIWRSAGAGLSLRGGAGTTYDFALFNPAGNYLARNPTGTSGMEFPGKVTGADTVVGSLGVRAGALKLTGRFIDQTTSVTSGSTTLGATHSTLLADASSGSITLNLPAASGNSGLTYTVLKTDATTNTVTLDGNASETIGGATTVTLGGNSGNSKITIVCDGTNWKIKDLYDEGTFTVTFTGMTTTVTGTASYTRVGKSVVLNLPCSLTGTSNSTSGSLTGIPAGITPSTIHFVAIPGLLLDNNIVPSTMNTQAMIKTDNTINFGYTIPGGGGRGSGAIFTASGSKGLYCPSDATLLSLAYTLQ